MYRLIVVEIMLKKQSFLQKKYEKISHWDFTIILRNPFTCLYINLAHMLLHLHCVEKITKGLPIYSDSSIFLAYDFLGPNNWVWTHCKFYPVKKNIHFANFSHTYSHIQKIKLLQLLWIAIWICYWNFKNS